MTEAKTPRISAPKPHRLNKGEPPQSAADTVVVGNNTRTGSDSQLVDINFKIPAELRKDFRLFCATHEVSQVSAFKEALIDYMKKKGWTPSK